MKIVFDKLQAEMKKRSIDNEYKKAKEDYIYDRKGRIIIGLLSELMSVVGCFASISCYIANFIDKFTCFALIVLSFAFMVYGTYLLFSLIELAKEYSKYDIFDATMYPTDVQFLILTQMYTIKKVYLKECFSTLRMIVTVEDNSHEISEKFIEIPNKVCKQNLNEPIINLTTETLLYAAA